MNNPIYCGIDVAKRNFVIGFSHQKKTKTETNNAKGIQHTLDYLSRFNVALITLEATGGLEIPVAKALARAGYRVFIANPLKASEFAKSQTRAKTDAKDAVNLAFLFSACNIIILPLREYKLALHCSWVALVRR